MSTVVLITGGYGYVGGRLIQHLNTLPGIQVRIGTRTVRPEVPAWAGEATQVHCDVSCYESLPAAVEGVDAVVHLAAMNEIECAALPEQALVSNGLGTVRLLRAASSQRVSRLVYVSTAHVYGPPLTGVIHEDCVPRPVHPYAITHLVAEHFVLAGMPEHRVPGVVVRLSNSIGAPAEPQVNRWTLLVNDLCRQAVEHRQLTLHSAGWQHRDFVPMSDVVRALAHVLGLENETGPTAVFNVGSGVSRSVYAMAQTIADRCAAVLGFRPKIERPTSGETVSEEASLTYQTDRLRRTGFTFLGSLEQEIDETLLFCRRHFMSDQGMTA